MLKKLFLVSLLLLLTHIGWAQDFPPKPSTLVTDYTNTLSDAEKAQLEHKLVAFDDSSSTQIAVVLIKSVGDYDINEYGTQLGRKWGIGQSGKNNGVLVLAAMNDHKITIQTGYGLEGALPDATTQVIIQDDIKPNFKSGNYYAGLDKATDDIIKATKGEFKANPRRHKSDGGSAGFVIIIVIIILVMIFRNRGGGGQIIGSRGGASPFWWFLAGNMLGSSGRGGWGGGGSGWGGGSSGGGGGFGGFGGGSFGGGGSSGSW